MIALFFAYLLAISIGVGVEQVHKAKKDCSEKQTIVQTQDGTATR